MKWLADLGVEHIEQPIEEGKEEDLKYNIRKKRGEREGSSLGVPVIGSRKNICCVRYAPQTNTSSAVFSSFLRSNWMPQSRSPQHVPDSEFLTHFNVFTDNYASTTFQVCRNARPWPWKTLFRVRVNYLEISGSTLKKISCFQGLLRVNPENRP